MGLPYSVIRRPVSELVSLGLSKAHAIFEFEAEELPGRFQRPGLLLEPIFCLRRLKVASSSTEIRVTLDAL
jgi:hypothetical protein